MNYWEKPWRSIHSLCDDDDGNYDDNGDDDYNDDGEKAME